MVSDSIKLLLSQERLAEAQKQHATAILKVEQQAQEAFTACARSGQQYAVIHQQLMEKTTALAASQKALADANAAAAASATASQVGHN